MIIATYIMRAVCVAVLGGAVAVIIAAVRADRHLWDLEEED